VMALGVSVVTIFEALVEKVDASFLLVHQPWDNVRILGWHGEREVKVVTCRMSFAGGVDNQLFWIFFLAIIYRYIPFLRKNIYRRSGWIRCVVDADVVGDIRGGDSFSDIYGFKRFFLAAIPILVVLLVRRKIVHLPQTYGPFSSKWSKLVAGFILKRSSVMVARYTDIKRFGEELVGGKVSVRLPADVAFMLKSKTPAAILTQPAWKDLPASSLLGLNVNGLMYNGGYDRKDMFSLTLDYQEYLKKLVSRLLGEFTFDIVLIPHTYAKEGDVESDNEACLKLYNSVPDELRSRVRVVIGSYDQHEIKGVIGRCGVFVGSRMHACIAALSQGIPCVGVAYSRKFSGVFRSVGMEEWVVDGKSERVDGAVDRTLSLISSRESVVSGLKSSVERAKLRLRTVFSEILSAETGGRL